MPESLLASLKRLGWRPVEFQSAVKQAMSEPRKAGLARAHRGAQCYFAVEFYGFDLARKGRDQAQIPAQGQILRKPRKTSFARALNRGF
ncbi:hypothetical protein [uncultured Campylobacter sp.]|uniref:hypothetical protein n=1 Tax=uncultured Campylobacter sp. TaxID=218934 RepID=UPI0026368D9E|nr:hypothetical protein [uncultured Campylobacter sp.]